MEIRLNWEFWVDLGGLLAIQIWFVLNCVIWFTFDTHQKFKNVDDLYGKFWINISQMMFVSVFIHWVRALLSFRVSRQLTPILKILGKMIKEFFKFLAITSLSFFLFMFSGTLLFRDVDNYSTLYKTAITLFAAGLGDFDFGHFDV